MTELSFNKHDDRYCRRNKINRIGIIFYQSGIVRAASQSPPPHGKLESKKAELVSLTQTERRILKLIAKDKTSKEIAQELFISHRTVHAHAPIS